MELKPGALNDKIFDILRESTLKRKHIKKLLIQYIYGGRTTFSLNNTIKQNLLDYLYKVKHLKHEYSHMNYVDVDTEMEHELIHSYVPVIGKLFLKVINEVLPDLSIIIKGLELIVRRILTINKVIK